MNFNDLGFLLLFLPAVLAVFYLVPAKLRLAVIVAASLFFYGLSGIVPLEFMVMSVAWGYGTGFVLARVGGRAALAAAISFPLIVLYFFKYLGFTLASVGAGDGTYSLFGPILAVTLPAGISFYTFQIVSYSIDQYDRSVATEDSPLRFAAYISFFPQLIAGPILRYSQIREQLIRIQTQPRLHPDVASGLKFLSVGLFAKTFGSDILLTLQERFNPGLSNSSPDAAFSVLAYSFIIYYDFWSYSLMAIGLGKLFCIDLPRNFLEPYKSTSPQDFWRRWHVTLSYWLRDYVYLRLGGNLRYTRNILIVFLACGLWHGAGWNFLVWGGYHGAFVVLYHVAKPWWDRLPQRLAIALTFSIVTLGWPLFYLDLTQYAELLSVLFAFTGEPARYGAASWALLAAIATWTFWVDEEKWLFGTPTTSFFRVFQRPAFQAGLVTVAVLFFSYSRTFIYFRF